MIQIVMSWVSHKVLDNSGRSRDNKKYFTRKQTCDAVLDSHVRTIIFVYAWVKYNQYKYSNTNKQSSNFVLVL